MSETNVTEIKSLEGHPLADEKARADIAALSEEMENLKNDKTVNIPYTLLMGKRQMADGTVLSPPNVITVSEHLNVVPGVKIIAPDPEIYKFTSYAYAVDGTETHSISWHNYDTTIEKGYKFFVNIVRNDDATVTESDIQAVYESMKFVYEVPPVNESLEAIKKDVSLLKQTVLADLGGKIEYVAITGNAGGLVSNCAESLLLAAHSGLDAAEVDIRLASDGVPVLSHNADLSTDTDAPAGTLVSSVTSVTMKEYKYDKYDYMYDYFTAPVRLITLAECIDLCKRYGMRVYLDIKDDGYDHDHQTELLDAVIAATVQAGIDKSCCFISTNQTSRLYIREKLPHAIIGYKTYIDSKTVGSDLVGVEEIGGNVMLQAETLDGSTESVLAALTPERIAAYRGMNLPIKDIDYYFTFSKPDERGSGIRYVFTFTTSDSGATWRLLPAQSSAVAASHGATLTKDENAGNTTYIFACPLLNGDLIRTARPSCVLEGTTGRKFTSWYTNTGVKFVTEATWMVANENVRVYINF